MASGLGFVSYAFGRLPCLPQIPWTPDRVVLGIQRRSRPMGVRVYGDGFPNEFAAKLAGEKALRELLDNLANEPEEIGLNQPAVPSCEKCGGSTVVPGLGTLPELLLFHCTRAGRSSNRRDAYPRSITLLVSRARGCRLLILKRVFTQCFPGARHPP
jgi:hypothetical protein